MYIPQRQLANLKEALSLYFEDEKVSDSVLIDQPQLVTVTIKA